MRQSASQKASQSKSKSQKASADEAQIYPLQGTQPISVSQQRSLTGKSLRFPRNILPSLPVLVVVLPSLPVLVVVLTSPPSSSIGSILRPDSEFHAQLPAFMQVPVASSADCHHGFGFGFPGGRENCSRRPSSMELFAMDITLWYNNQLHNGYLRVYCCIMET